MIDTCMVLWNQGSRHKGVKALFTFALICISLSLLLVTSIIPGWILLTRNTDGTTTHAGITQLSSVQGEHPATVIATTQIPVVSATASTVCVTSTPHVGAVQIGRRQPQASGLAGQPALSSSPTVVRTSRQHSNTGILIEAHTIYSGRSSGALSHLHRSAPEEILPTPTMTLTPDAIATAPSITITPHSPMRPHIARTSTPSPGTKCSEEIVKANPTVVAGPLLVASQILHECTPAH